MRRVVYSTTAADHMLQEERDMRDFRIPCKVEDLPEEMSFREFCREFYSVVPDDLTDEDMIRFMRSTIIIMMDGT